MSLIKLRVYQEAHFQFDSIVGRHPDTSSWPFALQYLDAELSSILLHLHHNNSNNSTTTNIHQKMYQLYHHCRNQHIKSKNNNDKHLIWRRRERSIAFSLIAKHCALQQYILALSLLNTLLMDDENDSVAWSQTARVQMMLGDIDGAERSVERGMNSLQNTTDNTQSMTTTMMKIELENDLALIYYLQGKHNESKALLDKIKQHNDDNNNNYTTAILINNTAIYTALSSHTPQSSCIDATHILEDGFRQLPMCMLNEAIVANIGILYEYVPSIVDAKKKLGAWVAAAAPDDFNLTVYKTTSITT